MRLDILVPVHGRPWRAFPFIDSLRRSTNEDVLVTAIAGPDDTVTAAAWAKHGAHVLICPAEPGSFSQRVNYGYQHTFRDWMFIAGDDVEFHRGWLVNAERRATRRYSVVGTNDLGNGAVTAGKHATHMFVRREYVNEVGASWDGPGIVCHEGYRHCYVDNEIVEAAKQRGVWVMAIDSIVEHLHPSWGKAEIDETYKIGTETMGQDGVLFRMRQQEFKP